jgi:anti-sigma-K factor RskA
VDIQAYIQSGIIESYVLGMATDEEVAEVEQLMIQHPEVQKAVDDFADSVEQQAMANAVVPPPEIKSKIMQSLSLNVTSGSTISAVSNTEHVQEQETPVRSIKFWRIAAAASIIALVVSSVLNIYFYNRYSDTSQRYQALLTERNSLQASNNIYQTKLNDWQLAARMMANPGMLKITLAAVPGKDNGLMTTVFWDKSTKDVYLLTNKLPTPSHDKQYQLWALVDGKPVDAGMLDPECEGACKMKNIPKAQAFAITLEKKGGSPTPTMEQMFVMGGV